MPREGEVGKGKPLTHTAKPPGDRISGFNGLITQGPPGLVPRKWGREGTRGSQEEEPLPGLFFPHRVFSLPGHLWEAS